jgi:DNA-binding response OmpR family regulator
VQSQTEKSTIMVVDDTPANLRLLGEILHNQGYRVAAFPSGTLALRAASNQPPDLLLLDIMMPGMDGFEVCRLLKAEGRLSHIPVIFLSALDDTANKIKAFSQGGVDYITKPFQEAEILARVHAHLQIVTLQRKLREHNEHLEKEVAKRTHEITQAHARIVEMARLKGDFLRMISHELRTPANGLLGIGEILLEICPDVEEALLYKDIFRQSGERLRKLIEDAMLIADIERLTPSLASPQPLLDLLQELCANFPSLQLRPSPSLHLENLFFQGERTLFTRALSTLLSLSAYFCRQAPTTLFLSPKEEGILLHIELDALSLKEEQVAEFFTIDSTARAYSRAESMGLAPVVAHKILTTLGGGMRFQKQEETRGILQAWLPITTHPNSPSPP